MTNDPMLDAMILANEWSDVVIPILANLALLIVAAVARPNDGRLWLVATGVFGLVQVTGTAIGGILVAVFASRIAGPEPMLYYMYGFSLLSKLGLAMWWALLVSAVYRSMRRS
jgi:hypothetical protein